MKLNITKMLIWAAASFVLGGAAPASEVKPAAVQAIQLSHDLVYAGGHNTQTRMKAGPYTFLKQDKKGTYFVGPPGCLSYTPTKASAWAGVKKEMVGKVLYTLDCGLLLPAKAGPPKLFFVIGSAKFMAGPLAPPPQQLDPAVSQAIVANQPTSSPIASGIGAGIGGAIVGALAAAEQGRLSFPSGKVQPPPQMLKDAIK